MILRNNEASHRQTVTIAPAFVMCPAGLHAGVPQGVAQPHSMYAYAMQQAQRAVAGENFRRASILSMN